MDHFQKKRVHLLCVWSGVVFSFLILFGMIFLAQLMPPISPSTPPGDVIAMYQENITSIRTGMVVLMFASAFYIPFTGIVTYSISRIEGRFGVLSVMQVMGGVVNTLLFFYPPLWWLIAIYRMDRNPELILLLHDAAWLQYMGALAPFLMIMVSIAIAAFSDKREKPIFPRWLGYVNFWVLVLFLPNQLMFFFHDGPFAWSGLFGFWVPVTDFFIWITAMIFVVRSAILMEFEEAVKG